MKKDDISKFAAALARRKIGMSYDLSPGERKRRREVMEGINRRRALRLAKKGSTK